jgi:ribose transport system ATP-binding protein
MARTSTVTTTRPTAEHGALRLSAIRKAFGGVEVLHGVDLVAPPGEVLALLGENGAGKSTIVKIIAGEHRPDAGEIELGGERHVGLTPVRARALGVRMIFQELSDAPSLSVAENISLGRLPTRGGVVDWREMRGRASRVLDELGVAIDPDRPTESLTLGERQIIEIARAASGDVRVLILDEPTAALSAQEVERLFELIRRLRERGVALIYITHRLDEVTEIGDRVQVLRDGVAVLDEPVGAVTRATMVSAMVGRAIGEVQRPPAPALADGAPAISLGDASSAGAFEHVELDVRHGEIVALYGKLGSGTAEVAEAVFGLRRLSAGQLALDAKPVTLSSPAQAIAAGVGLLPADRQRQGTFAVRSVAENLAAPSWRQLSRWRQLITARREAAAYRQWHDVLRVRSRDDPAQPIGTLSGGNQQKVLLGRWFQRGSRALVLIEPTRGVDVGARQDIYRSIRELAAGGAGVLIATSDYEEVVQVADRAAVMARGKIVARLEGAQVTTEALTEAAGG